MPIFLITIVSLIILGIILSFFAKEKDKGSFVFIFVIISGSIIGGMMVTGVIAYFSVVLFLPLILVGYAIYWIINQLFLKLEGNDLNNSRLVLNIGFYFAKK